MRKAILLQFLPLWLSMSFSQGNLQFNRSLFLNMEIYNLGNISVSTPSLLYLVDTVHLNVSVGKTVKIESIRANFVSFASWTCSPVPAFISSGDSIMSHWTNSPNTVRGPIIKLDEVTIFWEDAAVNAPGNFIRKEEVCPIWLPSGNYVLSMATQVGVHAGCGPNYIHDRFRMKGFVSAIEFNIIP